MSDRDDLRSAVAAADGGPQVAAIFDFDGTLLAGYSAALLSRSHLRRRETGPAKLLRSTVGGIGAIARGDMNGMIALAAESMAGQHHDRLDDLAERDFASVIAPRLHSEARALLEAHRERGHTLVLASSATNYQVEPAGRALGFDHVLCSRLELDADGVATGRLSGRALWGEGKAEAVAGLASSHGLDLAASFAYSDGAEDVPMLSLVGHPRVVNPGGRLSRTAGLEGWETLRFTSRDRASMLDVARSGLAAGALWPVLTSAAGVGLARRDRRTAGELVVSLWPDLALSIGGVALDVSGAEHLHAGGPAIVAFNHRTLVDELVIARLLRRDFVMMLHDRHVAERVVGAIGRRLGVVLSDGDAADVTAPIAEALAVGRAVAIALPEHPPGSTDLGGTGARAMRLAAHAGVPVVPVLIHDADDLQRRGGVVRAGRLAVDVGAPIPAETVIGDPVAARASLEQALGRRWRGTP